jgi:hypothetical protein
MQHSAYDSASAEGFYPSLKTVNIVDAKAVRRADPLPSRPSCARLRCAVQHCCTARNIVAPQCNVAAQVRRADLVLSPVLHPRQLRFVVTWDSDDLDLEVPRRVTYNVQRAAYNVRCATYDAELRPLRRQMAASATRIPRCSMLWHVAACCGTLQVLLRTPDGCIVSRTSRTCSHAARELNGDDAVAALELAQCGRFPVPL